jgi:hypothetical protein
MIRRSTWIVLAIFSVLILVAVLWRNYKKNNPAAEPTPTVQAILPALYDLGTDVVTRIRFADAGGKTVEVERAAAYSSWVMVGESEATSDTFRIETLAGQLFALQAMTTFETAPAINTVGLVIPAYTITMTTSAGNSFVTRIGDITAVGTGYYVQVDNGAVIVVDQLEMQNILDILTNPPIMPTPTAEIIDTVIPESDSTPTP